mmetsp:Transcript_22833/g.59577  ORF Transcript_22833/g.59577 Transcript_22833/m.59577 type:complete len:174 (+) Transcript_22833:471-992(+)
MVQLNNAHHIEATEYGLGHLEKGAILVNRVAHGTLRQECALHFRGVVAVEITFVYAVPDDGVVDRCPPSVSVFELRQAFHSKTKPLGQSVLCSCAYREVFGRAAVLCALEIRAVHVLGQDVGTGGTQHRDKKETIFSRCGAAMVRPTPPEGWIAVKIGSTPFVLVKRSPGFTS